MNWKWDHWLRLICDKCRFHSLHHTQFRTNYSLFMPLYDYIYGTMDKSSDTLYETSIKRHQSESADVVHLTHLTTPDSIYHLRLGFASLASKPHSSSSRWYLWFIWPLTCFSVFFTWTFASTFISERNTFHKLELQTWVLPRYIVQVSNFFNLFLFVGILIYSLINHFIVC